MHFGKSKVYKELCGIVAKPKKATRSRAVDLDLALEDDEIDASFAALDRPLTGKGNCRGRKRKRSASPVLPMQDEDIDEAADIDDILQPEDNMDDETSSTEEAAADEAAAAPSPKTDSPTAEDWETVIDLAFWRSDGSGVPADLAGPPIWLPIWRRSGGGRSGENLAVLATAPFWRRLVRKGRNADPKVTPKGDRISVPSRGF